MATGLARLRGAAGAPAGGASAAGFSDPSLIGAWYGGPQGDGPESRQAMDDEGRGGGILAASRVRGADCGDRDGAMSNVNWVCFDCRESVRRPGHQDRAALCPRCAQSCRCLGYRTPVPPKQNVRAWQRLRRAFNERAVEAAVSRFEFGVRQRHRAERELRRLEAGPASPGRAKAMKRLKRRMPVR